MADYNDKTIESYPSQDKRYDDEGQNKWLYKFDETFDADHTLPTFQGLNVYSAYIRNYIDKQKNILQSNITNNLENISNHESRISDLEQGAMDNLAEAILNGTRNVYILKEDFSIDYAGSLDNTYIKIPIITEYFEGINDTDCIFKPNGIDAETIQDWEIENLEEVESGKFNIDLASMRARFEAYLKYCYKNNNSLVQADRYNALIDWQNSGTGRAPNALDFTTFFSFPFRTFLPTQMADLDEGDLIYDPYSKNLYEINFSEENLYVYGLAEYNSDSSNILNQLWHMNTRDGQRRRTYLQNFYQNIGDWVELGNKKDRFNYAARNLSYGLIGSTEESIDTTKFVYSDGYVNTSLQTTCMNDGHNVKIRSYTDQRILCTFTKNTLKQSKQEANPFGALFVFCKKIATLSNSILWTTTRNDAEIAPYEYNVDYLDQFLPSILGIRQSEPITGDYIYNRYSSELVKIAHLPSTSELDSNLTTCLTEAIKKQKLGVFRNEECWEYTYLKGHNVLIKFDNKQIIENKLSEIYLEYPDVSKYEFTDPINKIHDFNALYFLQPEVLANENLDLSNTNKIQVLLNNFIKEKDIIIGDNRYYEIVKKTYSLSSESYPNYHIFAKEINQIVPNIDSNYIIDLGSISLNYDSENQIYTAQLTSEENLFQNIWNTYNEGKQVISLRFTTFYHGSTNDYSLPLYSAQRPGNDPSRTHTFTNQKFYQTSSGNHFETIQVTIRANGQINIAFIDKIFTTSN